MYRLLLTQDCRDVRRSVKNGHNKKLLALSEEQQRPLFSVQNTVILHELDETPPKYVMDTLSLGPKNSVLEKFNPHDVLAELDGLLSFCKDNNVTEDVISDINIKTIAYIKKCKKQVSNRNVQATKRYLKEKSLLAVPFDKGVGICVMKRQAYEDKLSSILQLPQFEKLERTRKNEKHPVFKEEEMVRDRLKELLEEGKIDENLYNKMWPSGSQPARLYGLAKVHKTSIPARPVLSMPGSVYHPIANQVTKWLNVVPECQINTSTQRISTSLSSIKLDNYEVIISFDVASLYTNVPVQEAIDVCTEMLYSGNHKLPPVDKDTFKELAQLCTCNVLMQTHDGLYRQTDGLAMGSPPAPLLANGWLSQFDPIIMDDAKLRERYMDDILRSIRASHIQQKLEEINRLHPSLKFTIEIEINAKLPFLDMLIIRIGTKLSSTWYSKPTDTGLIMNYHSLAPKIYKRSVVAGFVFRIHRACSTWKNFDESLKKAKCILEQNQYPPDFYEPIISKALDKIMGAEAEQNSEPVAGGSENPEISIPRKLIFIEYRGKITEDFARALRKANAPCQPVMTLRKLKTVLPSLKPAIEKRLRSHIVYQIDCPRCYACYVGKTNQHNEVRFGKHKTPSQPVGKHLRKCGALKEVSVNDVKILAASTRGDQYLLTLEALWQKELRPTINTKDEYQSRTLTVMW